MFFQPIIARKGVAGLAAALALPAKNVRRWVDSDSIPAEWWKPLADAGVASLDELAAAAQTRRLGRQADAA